MTIDLDKLESLAKAATPGPWENSVGYRIYSGTKNVANAREEFSLHEQNESDISREAAAANAAYIAAANPDVVLELIAELRAKNKLLEEIFDDCGGKDSGACPVCSTYTHKSWCWYPHLAKMLGKPLDEFDERFLAKEKK